MTYKGIKQAIPGASGLVYEYVERKRLASLGFTSSLSHLDSWKADAFVFIDSQIDKLNSEEMKKKQKGKKHG